MKTRDFTRETYEILIKEISVRNQVLCMSIMNEIVKKDYEDYGCRA